MQSYSRMDLSKSGWAFTVRVNGTTVAEESGAVSITTSSMLMEVKAIVGALRYLREKKYKRAVIVTDSMSTLQKVQKENLNADCVSKFLTAAWNVSPGCSVRDMRVSRETSVRIALQETPL